MKISLILVLMLGLLTTSFAQDDKKAVKFSGSMSLSDNFYSANGIDPRQPSNMFMAVFRANVNLFDQVDLPFELYYSNYQSGFQQPFNQFGVSPKIGDWLTLHGGYFSTRFSDFTFGDLRLLGGGLEITPGDFRLKAVYGRTRKAVEQNKVSYMPEVYKQNVYALCLGYGNVSKTFLNINLFHAIDDSLSVQSDTALVTPNENLVASLDFGVKMGKSVLLKGEVGVSAFSIDLGAQKIDDISISSYLFTPNISTEVDAAAKLLLNIKPSKYWSIGINSRWVGPGFRTLGYALMPNDLMEISLMPTARFLKNKLNVRAKAGVRYNNLKDHRMSTTSRFTGFVAANYQVSKVFGIDLNYNQNQIESGHKNDTLRLSNVFNSISVSPRFFFNGFGGLNNLILTYSYQDVSDKNIYTSEISNNSTNSMYLVHSLTYVSSLSFATSILYNNIEMPNMTLSIFHMSETISKRFFNNSLNLSASLGANFVKAVENNTQLVFRVNASYNLKKFGSLSFNISNNSYNGTSTVVQDYSELYGSIQYNINF